VHYAWRVAEKGFKIAFMMNKLAVERIDLMSFGRIFARPIVLPAGLSRRHKSDNFNSFLIHMFF
jgi:hypothetical protein